MTHRDCKAKQHSDQMICDHCGLVWDMNDPEPPECRLDVSPPKQQKVSGTTDEGIPV